jgi:DEAD/DEAH box helicase domain-containing protein
VPLPFAVAVDRAARLAATEATAAPDTPSRLVHHRLDPSRAAVFGVTTTAVDPRLLTALGVERLYRHQAAGIDAWRSGHSVVLATGTASGKSLVSQVAIADAAARPVVGTALAIFPTKALATDQLRALVGAQLPGVVAATYDGDTDRSLRADIRRDATVVFTNPDMLHYGILPHHARWVHLLARLEVIVVDELHTCRGVFGAHVAHVLRRLVRLARHYGADPRFVCSSATVDDPAGLARTICGTDAVVIDVDGSPAPPRHLAVWNPPVLDQRSGTRSSITNEVAGLVADLVRAGHRTLAFVPSRRGAEIVAERVRHRLPADLGSRVAAYRGGFLAEERSAVEHGLADGSLDAVIATSALEVGIDIGGIDAVVLHGFPGTPSSFWQQVGRVGRRDEPSLAVLVCGPNQLDQWIAAHPEVLVRTATEPVIVATANPMVVDAQLRCAAFELSFTHDDETLWRGMLDDGVRRLVGDGSLLIRPAGAGTVGRPGRHRRVVDDSPVAVWHGAGWPVDAVGLRASSPGHVSIVDESKRRIGSVDVGRAAQVVHPDAVYLHAGRSWRVQTLDLIGRRAVVADHDGATTTTPRVRTRVRLGAAIGSDGVGRVAVSHGPTVVATEVTSYVERTSRGGVVVGGAVLDLPETVIETDACWFVFPDAIVAVTGRPRTQWLGAMHAIEHALLGVASIFGCCDRIDVGGASTIRHRDTRGATVVLHERIAGGSGIAARLAAVADEVMAEALVLLEACRCERGCPSCVHDPHCGRRNSPLDRDGARLVLRAALAGPAALDATA